MDDDRQTGRTTGIFEDAISHLGRLPDDCKVYITGANARWLDYLEREFLKAGLVGIVCLTLGEIRAGALRGVKGVLLIDDWWHFTLEDQQYLYDEMRRLEVLYGVNGSSEGCG